MKNNKADVSVAVHQKYPYDCRKGSFMKQLIPLSAMLALSGCASIAGNTSYPVSFRSTPSDADFLVTNQDGQEVYKGKTPSIATLKSSAGYFDGEKYTVKFSKEGYGDSREVVDSSLSDWYWGNLLFGGPLGLLVIDPATGAMWKLPENVPTSLDKKP